MALPTKGRVILETTVGEIEIELWAKETPKACRNFIALSMEGYYDGVIFHRVVPNFLVQTGDRTGTGGGGESFYGDQFEDEIHPRLRFAHRGLVAMANNGEKNTNDSQFFITLDRADELNGKHTLFGRVVGNTIYNVLKIGEAELDKNERPIYPPKIRSVRIEDNPFDDIVPRITAAEKQAQKRARDVAQKEQEEAARRKGAKKNVGLLSFGDAGDEEEAVSFKKKPMNRPDLLDAEPASSSMLDIPLPPPSKKARTQEEASTSKTKAKSKLDQEGIVGLRDRHEQERTSGSSRQEEIAKMEADIKRLARKKDDEDSDDDGARKKSKTGSSALEEQRAKYLKRSTNQARPSGDALGKPKKRDERDLLSRLDKFKSKLRQHAQSSTDDMEGPPASGAVDPDDGNDGEAGDDDGWMAHRLVFPKGNEEEVRRAEQDYEVIDTRLRSAEAREEDRERRRAKKSHVGSAFRRGR